MASVIRGSLNAVLRSLEAEQFRKLYSDGMGGGFLSFDGEEWVLSHVKIDRKKKLEEYLKIMEELSKNGLPEEYSRVQKEALIFKINEFFTEASDRRRFFTKPNQEGENEIRFNSKVEHYEYLSNFFNTLVLNDRDEVFPSVEALYHNEIIYYTSGGAAALEDKMEDPIKIKKKGDSAKKEWLLDPLHKKNDLAKKADETLKQAEFSKYTLNPKLAERLVETGDAKLVEESTTSLYFGSHKDETGKEMGRNRLGEILTEVRTFLNQRSS